MCAIADEPRVAALQAEAGHVLGSTAAGAGAAVAVVAATRTGGARLTLRTTAIDFALVAVERIVVAAGLDAHAFLARHQRAIVGGVAPRAQRTAVTRAAAVDTGLEPILHAIVTGGRAHVADARRVRAVVFHQTRATGRTRLAGLSTAIDIGLAPVAPSVVAGRGRALAVDAIQTCVAVGRQSARRPGEARIARRAAAIDIAFERILYSIRTRSFTAEALGAPQARAVGVVPTRLLERAVFRTRPAAINVGLRAVLNAIGARRTLARSVDAGVAAAVSVDVAHLAVVAGSALDAAIDVRLEAVQNAVIARGARDAHALGTCTHEAVVVVAAYLSRAARTALRAAAIDVGLGAIERAIGARDLGARPRIRTDAAPAVGFLLAHLARDTLTAVTAAIYVGLVAIEHTIGTTGRRADIVRAHARRAVGGLSTRPPIATRIAVGATAVNVRLALIEGAIETRGLTAFAVIAEVRSAVAVLGAHLAEIAAEALTTTAVDVGLLSVLTPVVTRSGRVHAGDRAVLVLTAYATAARAILGLGLELARAIDARAGRDARQHVVAITHVGGCLRAVNTLAWIGWLQALTVLASVFARLFARRVLARAIDTRPEDGVRHGVVAIAHGRRRRGAVGVVARRLGVLRTTTSKAAGDQYCGGRSTGQSREPSFDHHALSMGNDARHDRAESRPRFGLIRDIFNT